MESAVAKPEAVLTPRTEVLNLTSKLKLSGTDKIEARRRLIIF
jgi:hypothetical protein